MLEKLHSTTKILPLKERVEIASRMAHRVFTHFELWRVTATVESRKRHWDALDDHWDHMRFLEHGQLVTAVVEIHSLLDANEATVNLPHLLSETEAAHGALPSARSELKFQRPYFDRLRPLRNAVFAHRTKKRTNTEIFRGAKLTPNHLTSMSRSCLIVVNELRSAVGLEPEAPSPLPRDSYERMLAILRPDD